MMTRTRPAYLLLLSAVLPCILASSPPIIPPANVLTITGTTVGPGYSRKEGQLALECPSAHPYPVGDRSHCCDSSMRASDSSALLRHDDALNECAGTSVPCDLDPGKICKISATAGENMAVFAKTHWYHLIRTQSGQLVVYKALLRAKSVTADPACRPSAALDTEPGSGQWYNAIGTSVSFGGGIAGPALSAPKAELYAIVQA